MIHHVSFNESYPVVQTIVFRRFFRGIYPLRVYIYPSRLEYLSPNPWVRRGFMIATLLWGLATAGMLLAYPNSNPFFVFISIGYALLYFLVSLYRTLRPAKFPDAAQAG